METRIYIKASSSEMEALFNNHINHNADIRSFQFVTASRSKVVVRHNKYVLLKEGATYTLKGFLTRCVTTLDKLKNKLSDLESKLFDAQCDTNRVLDKRGWGYGMRHSKIGFSTRKEDALKDKIASIKKQIKELEEQM